MKYKHIIWDFDGTLFDTYPIFSGTFKAALSERGITEPQAEILSLMKVSIGHAYKHYREKHALDEAFFNNYKKLNKETQERDAKPYEGIAELCKAICENGGKNYIYTHKDESAYFYLKKFGMMECFAGGVTQEGNFPRKPAPDAILHLLDKFEISAKEALMVGDRDIDVLAGVNAGICGCYFSEGSGRRCDGAEYNVDCLVEMYGVLGIGGD